MKFLTLLLLLLFNFSFSQSFNLDKSFAMDLYKKTNQKSSVINFRETSRSISYDVSYLGEILISQYFDFNSQGRMTSFRQVLSYSDKLWSQKIAKASSNGRLVNKQKYTYELGSLVKQKTYQVSIKGNTALAIISVVKIDNWNKKRTRVKNSSYWIIEEFIPN